MTLQHRDNAKLIQTISIYIIYVKFQSDEMLMIVMCHTVLCSMQRARAYMYALM